MAVDLIRPLGGREATFGRITEWTANRRWLVHTTSRFDEEWQILEAGWNNNPQLFPIPYTNVLPSQPMLLCRSIGGKQMDNSPQHWTVTAEYSSAPLSQQQKDAQQYENPLDRPSRIKWSSARYNKACAFDVWDNIILMSSGEPPDPPAEKDESRWIITVAKNVAAVPALILDYQDGVNDAAFLIQGIEIPQYCAKLSDLAISEEQTAQTGEQEWINYYEFGYSMELRLDSWALKLLDQGYYQIWAGGLGRARIKDDSVPPKDVVRPWPLDGNGGRLDNPNPSNVTYLNFIVYPYVDFGVLPAINGNP
jgi:hypothetical protein